MYHEVCHLATEVAKSTHTTMSSTSLGGILEVMRSHVFVPLTALHKGLGADGAAVRSFASVEAHM